MLLDDSSLLKIFDLASELNKVLSCRSKYLILYVLALNDGLTFSELRNLTGLSDGTLGKFLKDLQSLKLITKVSLNGKTIYKLTDKGMKALIKTIDLVFDIYKEHIEKGI